MILNADEVRNLYGRTAGFYDRALLFYRLIGVDRQRRTAVQRLRLQPGNTVVNLGCGTGANFPFLEKAVGPSGRIIGVDLSAAMLERARLRLDKNDWTNVDLVEGDVRDYALLPETAGVVAAFALEMVPDYDAVIEKIANALPVEGRLALLGVKHPERWPGWLVDLGIFLNRPFGVDRDYAALRPWQAVRRHMTVVEFEELYAGAAYRCVGQPDLKSKPLMADSR